ncbi:MAG: hypothetical protein KKC46_01485 [Proteobacteria bacterium]|nr:hypothetical protein [Pseudomonadota bacterium]
MWPHEMTLLTSWYGLLVITIFGLVVLEYAESLLSYSRYQSFIKWSRTEIVIILLICMFITLLIVDISHTLEIVIFYVYLFLLFIYPLLTLVLAMIQKNKNFSLNGKLVCNDLKLKLDGENLTEIDSLLKLLPKCEEINDEVIVQSLCDDRPEVRMATATVAKQLKIDEPLISCIQGKPKDFKRLSDSKDKRVVPHLIKRAEHFLKCAKEKKGGNRTSLIVDAITCFNVSNIEKTTAEYIVNIFKECDYNDRKVILKKIFKLDENGDKLCSLLLNASEKDGSEKVAETFWALLKANQLNRNAWQGSGRILWNKFSKLIAIDICGSNSSTRKLAATTCMNLIDEAMILEGIVGDLSDFSYLVKLGYPPFLKQLILNATSNSSESRALNSIHAFATQVEENVIPVPLLKILGEMDNVSLPVKEYESKQIPVSEELRDALRLLFEPRIIDGLFNIKAAMRGSMVKVAKTFRMESKLLEVIQGNDDDFKRIAYLDIPEYNERLIKLVKSADDEELSIISIILDAWSENGGVSKENLNYLVGKLLKIAKSAKGKKLPIVLMLIEMWTKNGFQPEANLKGLLDLIKSASDPVANKIITFLIDQKDLSIFTSFLNSEGKIQEVYYHDLEKCSKHFIQVFGKDAWESIQTVKIKEQKKSGVSAAGSSIHPPAYPELTEDYFDFELVDSKELSMTGAGINDFQSAISKLNESNYNQAAVLFRSAIQNGVNDLCENYAKAELARIALKENNLIDGIQLFASVLKDDRVLYESAQLAAQYLFLIYKELGRESEVLKLEGLATMTMKKSNQSFSPDEARRVKKLVNAGKINQKAQKTDSIVEKAIKDLIKECEWHIMNANQYETKKEEFKRRENNIVRPIGEKLHKEGGLALMRNVYQQVEKVIIEKHQKSCDSALNMKWGRIGDWRS